MEERIQIRLSNLRSDDWRADLQSEVKDHALQSSVKVLDPETRRPGSTAAIDPQIVAAAITGGAAIIVALIPVVVDLFRKKTKTPTTVINVTLHGTANSQSLQVSESIARETLDAVLDSIGGLTEIDVG